VPPLPTIIGVTPGLGGPGTSLTVTVAGTSFQTGATVSFGAGITINSTTVVSSTELSVALTIDTTAALAPRDVTVTNPDGTSAVRQGGFAVATMSVAFVGKVRDKVGAGSAAFSADGALDATFQVSVAAGSGPRTVTRLELRRNAGGAWDTDAATAHWALGAAASLDGALLNAAGTGAVNFTVADGGTFLVFASDLNPSCFTPGTAFSLLVTLVDGSIVTLPTTLP
jgi:Quinohemoprotein amine dehydrogenase, alpha subunit domain III